MQGAGPQLDSVKLGIVCSRAHYGFKINTVGRFESGLTVVSQSMAMALFPAGFRCKPSGKYRALSSRWMEIFFHKIML